MGSIVDDEWTDGSDGSGPSSELADGWSPERDPFRLALLSVPVLLVAALVAALVVSWPLDGDGSQEVNATEDRAAATLPTTAAGSGDDPETTQLRSLVPGGDDTGSTVDGTDAASSVPETSGTTSDGSDATADSTEQPSTTGGSATTASDATSAGSGSTTGSETTNDATATIGPGSTKAPAPRRSGTPTTARSTTTGGKPGTAGPATSGRSATSDRAATTQGRSGTPAAPATGSPAPTSGSTAPATGAPAPTSAAPTARPTAPTTAAPTTAAPTTATPTTATPTTAAPTTAAPTTAAPTTAAPTTAAPTTAAPTTAAPTTATPTTAAPTTSPPTTAATTTTARSGDGSCASGAEFERVFRDDFSGSSLGGHWRQFNSSGNSNFGLRRPRANAVVDGKLVITASMQGGTLESGGMSHERAQTYGKYRVRVRTDNDPSQAMSGVVLTWPSSQAHPRDGENNIYETLVKTANRNPFYTFIHKPFGSKSDQEVIIHRADGSQWQVMTMEWTPDRITIIQDGGGSSARHDIPETSADLIPDVPHRLHLQLDAWKHSVSGPVRMEVDWAEVYRYCG